MCPAHPTISPMQFVLAWSDLFANVVALYRGRAGGHRWLVACPPSEALEADRQLRALDGKGEVLLLAYQNLTPLRLGLEAQGGAAVSSPTAGRGLRGVLVLDRDLRGTGVGSAAAGGQDDGAAASICADLGLPVRVCSPHRLGAALLEWWALTPHAAVPGPGGEGLSPP